MSSPTALEIVQSLLANALDPEVVRKLVSPTATYTSLCLSNPALKTVMPYAGVHLNEGPEAIIYTFSTVDKIWANEAFSIEQAFESNDGKGDVAIFGRFTYRSRVLGRKYESPFAVRAKVQGGQVTEMLFMEDTLGTTLTFAKGGKLVCEVEEGVDVNLGPEGVDIVQ